MLSNNEAVDLLGEIKKDSTAEWARLRRYVRYARGRQKLPWLPDDVETEYLDIARKSASNWLDLVLRSVIQGLRVDGYSDTDVWQRAWQVNGMDARQDALHRAAGVCGYAYNLVFPTDDGQVWIRPEAATKIGARYADPYDEWPLAAIRLVSGTTNSGDAVWELYDADARYTITDKRVVDTVDHDFGVTPVVQMRWALDLLGTPQGEIEPVIPIQDRIVDATFTLQMVAKYGAFPQRWIAGIKVPEDADGNPLPPQVKAYIDHILMAADPDTKFGQFAAADLRQYVEALDAHIKHLAAITQTPPHYLLGDMVNLSAEALAAAEAGLQRKIAEKRDVLGEGYEQTLRLAAQVLGLEAADDATSQVHWADIESRSLSQVSDALLKLSQLGVPLQVLLPMIPNLTKTDVDEAITLIESGDALTNLANRLEAGITPALEG